MDSGQYRDYLLNKIPSAKIASGGKVINCRCFFCPDSKNPSNKHMYISIPQSPSEPSLYYCHKCNASGVVNYKHLIQWDIYDENIALSLIEHNKKCSKSTKARKYMNSNHYNVTSYTTSDSDISKIKLDYINNRIGCKFTYEELRKLKIILNLKDLFRDNNISEYSRDVNVIDQLDINFLGFLSIDNAFLNMRRVCDEGLVIKSIDKRYINYRLFEDKYDTSERFYTVPTAIDLCSPNRIKIHVAEGPFDILSIYKNVKKEEPGIYTSVAGSNYKGIVMYFLEKYKLPYVEYHLYPDNDKHGSINKMYNIANYLRPLNIPLYIHKNIYPNEKDYGVPSSNIIDSILNL